MMKITCPKCAKVLKAPDEMAGKRGQCPFCGAVLVMPVPQTVHSQKPVKAPSDESTPDELLHWLNSVDPGTKIMPPDGWGPVHSAAEALLALGRPDAVVSVMKAWACATLRSHPEINQDAVALLEKCGLPGITALCEVLEHWLEIGPSGLPHCNKFKEQFLPVLEALGQLGPAASPSKPLIVKCLAFGHSDPAFEAEVRAAADRIAWNINLYALD